MYIFGLRQQFKELWNHFRKTYALKAHSPFFNLGIFTIVIPTHGPLTTSGVFVMRIIRHIV